MHAIKYELEADVWIYSGQGAWHFVTIPEKESKEIKELFSGLSRGWGSLPVNVRLGETSWRTSVFPDKSSGTYILPLKKAVRDKEGVADGGKVSFSIEILA
jgi:hypothetical protein